MKSREPEMLQAKNASPRASGNGGSSIEHSRHRFCVVNADVDEKSYRLDQCRRGKHSHIRWPELSELLAAGDQIKPLEADAAEPKQRKPDYVFEWLIPWRVLRRKRDIPTRGRSSKFGEYLSAEAAKRRPWACVMISEISEK
jgi:hypothetical protein